MGKMKVKKIAGWSLLSDITRNERNKKVRWEN